jgi:hypothetical protein
MPDLTGLPALDVAIGLSFIFLLLSLTASAIQEYIANLLSLRAKVLQRGLRNMLTQESPAPAGSAAAAATSAVEGPERDLLFHVYTHPLIRSMYRESWFPLGRTTLESAAGTEGVDAEAAGNAGSAPSPVSKVRLPSYIRTAIVRPRAAGHGRAGRPRHRPRDGSAQTQSGCDSADAAGNSLAEHSKWCEAPAAGTVG